MKPSDFVHLHNHTHYSVLDGLQKVPKMLAVAKQQGMDAMAITDHGTLSGVIEFYTSAKAAGIKPIIGMEAYMAARGREDKEPSKDKARYHLTLLAMNNIGYQNLMKLATTASLDGFYHKPRIDRKVLEELNEGLIVLSGCIGGEVGDAIRNNQPELAEKNIEWYKNVFGDRYYLELQDHGKKWDEQKRVNEKLLELGKKYEIDCVMTCDAHYSKEEDQEAHEVLLCVQSGNFFNDEKRWTLKDTDLFLPDPKEMFKTWGDNPELLTNTKKIADRCNVEIELGKILIPKFDVPEGESEKSYLHTLVYRGLVWRYSNVDEEVAKKLSIAEAKKRLTDEILSRTEYELDVIGKMGFDGYFLIVSDFITWGKDKGIVFGPGRGSAAGSIVSYAMKITELDPLEHDLLFERFLNPDRISMPDIDIDIQDSRRDEVIRYTVDKYGQERVAHIVTFGKMAARNAIRDVARVLEVPYAEADRLAKLVPPPVQGRHIPLATSVVEDETLKEEYGSNATSRQVMDLAIKLEGTIRSHGVHAAGVVIAPENIVKYTPLEMAQKGVVTTQYSMNPIEELGLLKMDFLGLSNLTIINNALRIVRKVFGKQIDLASLPLDDKKTYELLGRGDTTGVFQLESSGMKRYLKELKPNVFDDVIAMVSLYRPGPLTAGLTQKFINRKNGKEPVIYDHDSMKKALQPTYGVMVYQEQVMQIAVDMCGFSGGQADTLRKAVGKKKRDVMAKLKKEFIAGAKTTSGVDEKIASSFWKDLEGFADYAFNKSHAACYGLIAYQTAYLKAHYPAAFMAALMTSNYDDTEKLAIEITECGHMGIEVLPPDINESFLEFAVVPKKDQIRFGMSAIKNVGTGAVEEILRAREESHFKTIDDFVKRVSTRIVNRKAWESLIKAGAFDAFGERSDFLLNLDAILSYGSKLQKEAESGQIDLFGGETASSQPQLKLTQNNLEPNERQYLQWERELLGVYLSSHPLEKFEAFLNEKAVPIGKLSLDMDKKKTTIGGLITNVRDITTKNGKKMAFIGMADLSGELEAIAFPNTYKDIEEVVQNDAVVLVKGTINTKDREGKDTQELKILIDEFDVIDEEMLKSFKPNGKTKTVPSRSKTPQVTSTSSGNRSAQNTSPRLFIHVKSADDHERLVKLKKLLNEFPGETETILVFGDKDKSAVRLPFKSQINDELTDQIAKIFDKESVAIK